MGRCEQVYEQQIEPGTPCLDGAEKDGQPILCSRECPAYMMDDDEAAMERADRDYDRLKDAAMEEAPDMMNAAWGKEL